MPRENDFIAELRCAAPTLFPEVEELARLWLVGLLPSDDPIGPLQDKHFNDPIWGTITLHPWEVALLDTPLVQRLRGVKQLGLAHLVFPTATHDRFSHVCGVVEAADRMLNHIERNTKARARFERREEAAPSIEDEDRNLIRLAALLHDMGHGPFSHTIEPVVQRVYESDFQSLEAFLLSAIQRAEKVQVSEAIAALIVASEPFQKLLRSPLMAAVRGRQRLETITRALIAAIVGGSDGDWRSSLGAIVSSQVDADKLDYMARDAYHAGLPIDFDTGRLITKLEALRIESQALSPRLAHLRKRVATQGGRYYEIGISARGTGAFEQMLVGRVFLYDRLYHHHKVRAADAMAQRLVFYSDPSRSKLKLNVLYASLSDDTVVRAFGGLPVNVGSEDAPVTFPSTPASIELSNSILSRSLYKRAFAFAGRFIAGVDTEGPEDVNTAWAEDLKDAERSRVMDRVNRELADLDGRLAAESELAELAVRIGRAMPEWHQLRREAEGLAPHHVIVDLPKTPYPARITTIARNDDGRLDVPDVFYDPARWADVYASQRRTGYVFAHPDRRALICVAARIWFLKKFGCVLGEAAERQAKSTGLVEDAWYTYLERAGVITASDKDYLQSPRLIFVPLSLREDYIPKSWKETDPGFLAKFNADFASVLPDGVSAVAELDLVQALRGIFRTIQTWSEDSKFVTAAIESEKALQENMRMALRLNYLDVIEGEERGGGESDLIVGRSVVIENKIIPDPTDDPFNTLPKAGLQGRRYVLPTGQPFIITVLSYKARTETGKFPPSKCVGVRQLPGCATPFAEIRVVVRHSDSRPSKL